MHIILSDINAYPTKMIIVCTYVHAHGIHMLLSNQSSYSDVIHSSTMYRMHLSVHTYIATYNDAPKWNLYMHYIYTVVYDLFSLLGACS